MYQYVLTIRAGLNVIGDCEEIVPVLNKEAMIQKVSDVSSL